MQAKRKNQPDKPLLKTIIQIQLITFLALIVPSIIFALTGLISPERWTSSFGMIAIASSLAIILMSLLTVIKILRKPRKSHEKLKILEN